MVLVALAVLVAPAPAQETTTECETTMGDGMNETTEGVMGETTERMGNDSMGDDSMSDSTNETTGMDGESMAETTTCADGEMSDDSMGDDGMTETTDELDGDSMDDTTDAMGDDGMDGDSMDETTDAMSDDGMDDTTAMNEMSDQTTDEESSAFVPGFGVAAALVALLAALYVARE